MDNIITKQQIKAKHNAKKNCKLFVEQIKFLLTNSRSDEEKTRIINNALDDIIIKDKFTSYYEIRECYVALCNMMNGKYEKICTEYILNFKKNINLKERMHDLYSMAYKFFNEQYKIIYDSIDINYIKKNVWDIEQIPINIIHSPFLTDEYKNGFINMILNRYKKQVFFNCLDFSQYKPSEKNTKIFMDIIFKKIMNTENLTQDEFYKLIACYTYENSFDNIKLLKQTINAINYNISEKFKDFYNKSKEYLEQKLNDSNTFNTEYNIAKFELNVLHNYFLTVEDKSKFLSAMIDKLQKNNPIGYYLFQTAKTIANSEFQNNFTKETCDKLCDFIFNHATDKYIEKTYSCCSEEKNKNSYFSQKVINAYLIKQQTQQNDCINNLQQKSQEQTIEKREKSQVEL